MGSVKYLFCILILLSHNPYVASFFKGSPLSHTFTAQPKCCCFCLIRDRLYSRQAVVSRCLYRLQKVQHLQVLPNLPSCWLMLGLSFLLMPNSMLYLRGSGNVFSDIASLDLGDKIFYYASHVFLLINLLFYVSYDKATHSLDYFSIANHSSSVENAISLSVSPPLWTALPDVIIMLGFSYFSSKRRTNSLIFIYFLLIVAQCLIIAKTIFWRLGIHHHLRKSCSHSDISDDRISLRLQRNSHSIKSKVKAGLLAFMLLPVLAIGTSAMEMTNNYYASIFSFVIALVGYGVVCSLLWFAFSYKFDMILRDLSVHIYLWHFMVYSIFYSYFKPEPISSIALIVGYMVVVSAFAYYFERYNRHFVNYLLKKTAKTSHSIL